MILRACKKHTLHDQLVLLRKGMCKWVPLQYCLP
jgi:hypothetical protein